MAAAAAGAALLALATATAFGGNDAGVRRAEASTMTADGLAVDPAMTRLRAETMPDAIIPAKQAGAAAGSDAPMRLYGKAGSNLFQTLLDAGAPVGAAVSYMGILGIYVEEAGISPDDRYDLVIERHVRKDGRGEFGKLIYVGLYQENGLQLNLSQWTVGGRLKWYDAASVSAPRGGAQRPVPGEVSSNFGSRFHPILHYSRMHKGLDFRAGYGTPILAVQQGWVTFAGWGNGYGQQVALRHGGGMETTYSHMSSTAVQPGQLVQQGQIIGYVGATGLATGPHLHYELHRDGVAIDPASVSFTARPVLTSRDLAGYQARLRAILAITPTAGAPRA